MNKNYVYRKQWAIDNPDKIKKYQETSKLRRQLQCQKGSYDKKYYEENKDIYKIANDRWRENHKEELREYYRRYYLEHRDKIIKKCTDPVVIEKRKIYYQLNKDKFKERYEKNKDNIRKKRDTPEYREKLTILYAKQKEERRIKKEQKMKIIEEKIKEFERIKQEKINKKVEMLQQKINKLKK